MYIGQNGDAIRSNKSNKSKKSNRSETSKKMLAFYVLSLPPSPNIDDPTVHSSSKISLVGFGEGLRVGLASLPNSDKPKPKRI